MVIDEQLLNQVSEEAKKSPRLRMNYNFHQSLEDKCHRMLNAVEPGTVVPIHRHPTKDESFVILRGKVRLTTHDDDDSIIEDVVLSQESGNYGVDIPKNVWHKLESLESGSVIFEFKEGHLRGICHLVMNKFRFKVKDSRFKVTGWTICLRCLRRRGRRGMSCCTG